MYPKIEIESYRLQAIGSKKGKGVNYYKGSWTKNKGERNNRHSAKQN